MIDNISATFPHAETIAHHFLEVTKKYLMLGKMSSWYDIMISHLLFSDVKPDCKTFQAHLIGAPSSSLLPLQWWFGSISQSHGSMRVLVASAVLRYHLPPLGLSLILTASWFLNYHH